MGAGYNFSDGTSNVTGLCVYGEGIDRFIIEYAVQEMPRPVKWKIIDATGRYTGLTGEGTATSSVSSALRALQQRVTKWMGEFLRNSLHRPRLIRALRV